MAIFLDDFRYRVNRDGHAHERQKFATNRYTLTGKRDRTESGIVQKTWRYSMRMLYSYDPLINENWSGYETYRQLAIFESPETWTPAGGVTATGNSTYRVEGSQGLQADVTAVDIALTASPDNLTENMANSSANDYIDLWIYTISAASTPRVKVRFRTTSSDFFESPLVDAAASAWTRFHKLRSDFTATGSPDWTNITDVQIISITTVPSQAQTVVFDDLRLSFVDTPFFPNNEYYLVSGTWEIQPYATGERLVHAKLDTSCYRRNCVPSSRQG